jgi:hypothetical protein
MTKRYPRNDTSAPRSLGAAGLMLLTGTVAAPTSAVADDLGAAAVPVVQAARHLSGQGYGRVLSIECATETCLARVRLDSGALSRLSVDPRSGRIIVEQTVSADGLAGSVLQALVRTASLPKLDVLPRAARQALASGEFTAIRRVGFHGDAIEFAMLDRSGCIVGRLVDTSTGRVLPHAASEAD